MSDPAKYSGILDRERLAFRDNTELERYYEEKYRQGGYEAGCVRFGVNISAIYHAERHRSALRMLAPQPGDTVLDAGCGTGSLAATIAERSRTVHGIDIAANAFDPAYARHANLHFAKMNIEQLGFADATFDRVVCVEALEHVIDPDRAIRELVRVLKPGGTLVLTYPTINRTIMQHWHRRLRLTKPLAISEHLNEWSYDEVVAHVQSAGPVLREADGLVFDLGVFGVLKNVSRFFALKLTALTLKIRSFPRNSTFVSLAFTKPA